ncbi:hypothetical protein [Candidatus Korobacter versatilis]|nr:hypothetical protein [Candidatus Koribacter versatilis]
MRKQENEAASPYAQNCCIEIHDSELDDISLKGADAVLHFPKVYVHSSAGRPSIDRGTGWGQEAVLRIGNAMITGVFLEESRTANGGVHSLWDGALTIDGTVSDNLVPIPLDVHGAVELEIQCWGETVRISGDSARLELIGEPKYIERFEPEN